MTDTDTAVEIRALTVWQPWASCIAYGTKRIENRLWETKYRGRILIHAGHTLDRYAYGFPLARPFLKRPQPHGAVIAVGRIVDCHQDDGYCTLWSAPGRWHWRFTDVRPLLHPLFCRGARGLWIPDSQLASAAMALAVDRG